MEYGRHRSSPSLDICFRWLGDLEPIHLARQPVPLTKLSVKLMEVFNATIFQRVDTGLDRQPFTVSLDQAVNVLFDVGKTSGDRLFFSVLR